MALIYIRGKRDPIQVSNERGIEIKKHRFGEVMPDGHTLGKSEPTEDIDLGVWCGEIGQIRAVELEPKPREADPQDLQQQEEEARRFQEWIKQPPEKKARHFEYFKICWSVAHNFEKSDPPPHVLDEVYKIQLDYFKKNPKATVTPKDMFGSILPNKRAGSSKIAEKMKVKVNLDDIPS